MCGFTPVHCVNAGCPEKFAKEALDRHLEHCQFQVVACRFCGERYKRNQLEVCNDLFLSLLLCMMAGSFTCSICKKNVLVTNFMWG